MDYVYIFAGLFVFAIFIFKRELLIEKESLKIILRVSVILFVLGIVIHLTHPDQNSSCGALLAPLLMIGLFRLCRKIFLRLYDWEPRDTWFIWNAGMGPDRMFNIVYSLSALFLLILVTIVMIELTKAGL